jgi:hypothetical protein
LYGTKAGGESGLLVAAGLEVGGSLYGTKAGGESGLLVAAGLEVGGSLYKAGGEVRLLAAAEPIK